jgi:hypothetical protein
LAAKKNNVDDYGSPAHFEYQKKKKKKKKNEKKETSHLAVSCILLLSPTSDWSYHIHTSLKNANVCTILLRTDSFSQSREK